MILVCAVWQDVHTYRISNRLMIAGFLTGFGYQIIVRGFEGIREGILGMLPPVIFLFPAFLCRGIGAGDIKLLAVIGSWLSYDTSVSILAASIMLGGIYAVIHLFTAKRKEKLHMSIPIFLSMLLWLGGVY